MPQPSDSAALLAPALPRSLQVEVTGACNLRCRMCLVRYRPALQRTASMDVARFRSLLDGLPGLERVTLQGLGEPLMAPGLFEMVRLCKERGIACGFNSNGTLLTRRAAERLVDLELDWLHVSLDGARRETYEFVRDHARWDTVERNVTGLVEVMRQRDAARPALSIVMVLMRFNFRDLPAVVRRAAEWGIPRVRAQNLSHDFSDAPRAAYDDIAAFVRDQSLDGVSDNEVAAVFAEARAAASATGVALRLPRTEPAGGRPLVEGAPVPCAWPWRSSYVTWDGNVQPCCMVMGSDRATLARLDTAPIAEIWSDEAYRDFRRQLLEGPPPAVCRGCSEYRGTF